MADQAGTFILGLRRYIENSPGTTVVSVAAKAGVAKSTLHKLFQGAGHSPKVSTLEALAAAVGLSYDAVIALGRSENPQDMMSILRAFDALAGEDRRAALDYIAFLEAKSDPKKP